MPLFYTISAITRQSSEDSSLLRSLNHTICVGFICCFNQALPSSVTSTPANLTNRSASDRPAEQKAFPCFTFSVLHFTTNINAALNLKGVIASWENTKRSRQFDDTLSTPKITARPTQIWMHNFCLSPRLQCNNGCLSNIRYNAFTLTLLELNRLKAFRRLKY